MTASTSQAFFEEKYRQNADPWKFGTSEYELDRYQRILAALNAQRFRYAVEPGCSVGVLTSQLGGICDAVFAFDLSPSAVAAARLHCASCANVRIECRPISLCDAREADLLILSEIGYYLSRPLLSALLNRLVDELAPSATVLACHWLGHSQDHVLHGDEVHDVIGQTPGLHHDFGERHQSFRIDRWIKSGTAA